jgi:hypothetical protein
MVKIMKENIPKFPIKHDWTRKKSSNFIGLMVEPTLFDSVVILSRFWFPAT